jgi:hypothetical protein
LRERLVPGIQYGYLPNRSQTVLVLPFSEQGCSHRTATESEAMECADEEVWAHHSEFNRKPFSVGLG